MYRFRSMGRTSERAWTKSNLKLLPCVASLARLSPATSNTPPPSITFSVSLLPRRPTDRPTEREDEELTLHGDGAPLHGSRTPPDSRAPRPRPRLQRFFVLRNIMQSDQAGCRVHDWTRAKGSLRQAWIPDAILLAGQPVRASAADEGAPCLAREERRHSN
jgi:hypothetical protein